MCGELQLYWQHNLIRWTVGQRNLLQNPQGQPSIWKTESESPPAERHQTVNKSQGLQSCSSFYTTLWMWNTDYIPPTHQIAGTVSHKGTAHDHGHLLAGQSDKPRSTGEGWFNKHRVKAAEDSVTLDWPCHQNVWQWCTQTAGQPLYGELMCGSCKQRRPKLRFKDTLKSKLKWNGISPCELEASAADRSAWKPLTSRAAAAFEEDRRQHLAVARDRRHRAASASTRTTDYCGDTCGRLCASSFGLRSHMRSHRWAHRLCHLWAPTDY